LTGNFFLRVKGRLKGENGNKGVVFTKKYYPAKGGPGNPFGCFLELCYQLSQVEDGELEKKKKKEDQNDN